MCVDNDRHVGELDSYCLNSRGDPNPLFRGVGHVVGDIGWRERAASPVEVDGEERVSGLGERLREMALKEVVVVSVNVNNREAGVLGLLYRPNEGSTHY